ncbi:tripartite tricarboxylate transporter substrate binding protein [Devosia neptuniae]|jgi:tripartite-type tricarboxylate transporter receptor subunit TctC|uniref:Bug family tripartite tricarboxylate transporter substrate binding protein n=1 Tax=Devosia TaxID=46913 RepID=UPI0022AEEB02|nr:tripartite tricarboxylate transporter substrate binding protein [Devosia neptuniae]MCZ4347857.1 tripartite tricarboxylate transporter substrate binding protein [Devosia neptuniae]
MNRTMRLLLTCSAATVLVGTTMTFAQEWKPDRPINLIVPWGAGGSTDQVTRVTAPILAEALGVDVVVVNQPGASGAIGTQEVLNAPHDGYTWTANAIANNATYSVSGLLENTNIDAWHVYLSVANVPVVAVPADSQFADFGQLLEALQSDGGRGITVATAGVTSSGGTAIAALSDAAGGFEYNMVTYDGGGPAAIATASGEAMVTTQLAVEQTELIRGGRLRALAVLSNQPLKLDGVDPIPPITDWLPDMPLAPDYFGIFIPSDVPPEVLATVDKIWEEKVMTSPEIQAYAENFGAVFAPSYGAEARALAMPVVILEACSAMERGEAVNDPSTIGIDCETRTETGM